jgi:acetylornithine deacetylase/succinyl-diaminopimelate desuccinylase-like protein
MQEHLKFISDSAISWIQAQALELDLEFQVVRLPDPTEDGFTVLLTWPGLNPDLESILLSSHIDVVPADKV